MAVLLGCQGFRPPLATGDPFFASPSASSGQVGREIVSMIATQNELLEIQRACGDTNAAGELQEDVGIVCSVRPAGFYGRPAEAYRRWAEDQVRQLPSPSDTASSVSE